MFLRVWFKNQENRSETKNGIVVGPATEYTLAVRVSSGEIISIRFGEVDKSEWVTDPTAGVSSKPPRGKNNA